MAKIWSKTSVRPSVPSLMPQTSNLHLEGLMNEQMDGRPAKQTGKKMNKAFYEVAGTGFLIKFCFKQPGIRAHVPYLHT